MTAQPKISREIDPSEYSEVLNRLRQEPAISRQNSAGNARPEPTLDEAREDLARAIGEVAHSLFAKKYGPMVATVTKTTAEAVLKDLEKNAYRANNVATFNVQELNYRANIKKRIKQKETQLGNKQQTQAEGISLGLTVRNGRSPVPTGNLSDLSRQRQ